MQNVELHLHTDAYYNGIGDGAQTVVEAIDAASRAGATAVAITDHGNCANWVDFFNYANGKKVDHQELGKKGLNKVKPILGVEAYITKDEKLLENKVLKQHLILLAKDYTGFQQISRFVSDTNRHIDEKGRPLGTFEMLEEHFGEHPGHVICQSACVAGPLSTELLYNHRIELERNKILRRIEKSEESLGLEYTIAKRDVNDADAVIAQKKAEIEGLKPVASKTYGRAIQSIKKEKDDAKRALLEEALLEEKLATEMAKKDIDDLKTEIQAIKASISDAKKVLTKAKGKLETISHNHELIDILEGMIQPSETLYNNALHEAERYRNLFGKDFYAELQYHGIDVEDITMPQIADIAKELGIECVVTNDVHMATKDDLQKRLLLENCAEIKRPWRDAIEGDTELYYKTDEEKLEWLTKILPENIVKEGIENAHKIAEECNVDHISEAHHYPSYENATEHLRELALTGKTIVTLSDGQTIEIANERSGIEARYGEAWNDALMERFEYEMSVIDKMDFSSYFLFIADVINKCKTARDNATDIGPGRGSGAGSIVCYLSGITELDPIKYDLLFERFLNPSRVSMPDIDTDFSKFARQYAINYVTEVYGQRAVTGIMTKAKMGAKNALTYAPKLYAKEQGLDTRVYNDIGANLRKYIVDLKTSLNDVEEDIKRDFANNKDALKIFEYAKLIDGKITSYGQHAAGTIAIMDGQVEDYIPLMMAEDTEGNSKLVIQADMVAAEAQLGFIKFDFLGLKNLNVITACQQMVTNRYGNLLDCYNLPLDDERVFKNIFANANTNFVFQFESDGMKKMLKDLNPTRFEDLILAVSVYRPGPMDFIPDIIRCKNEHCDSEIVERFPVLRDTLADTYGYPVYQEQVMKIMTICAGFDLAHADNVRRFMSKKKEEELAAEKPLFIQGCVDNGTATKENAEWLFDQLMPFANYGFNKSHAAAYSLVSYITAYMKEYYPKEYLCAAMLEQGDKTIQLLNDCKKYGIEVLPVNVNLSSVDYSVEDDHSIRMGLSAIKGLKADAEIIVEERKNGAFESYDDFVKRCHIKSSSINACTLSGACDNLIVNREKAVIYAEKLTDALDKRREANEHITELKLAVTPNEKRIKEWQDKLSDIEAYIDILSPNQTFPTDDRTKRLYEMQYLGMYLSGSPLDGYDINNPKYKSISEVEEGAFFRTIGVVTGYREILTKNGDRMCVFSLLDKDSEMVSAVMFPQRFEELTKPIDSDMVVEIRGKLEPHEDEMQIVVSSATVLEHEKRRLHMNIESYEQYANIQDKLIDAKSDYGIETLVRLCGEEHELEFKVSEDIFNVLDTEDIEYETY